MSHREYVVSINGIDHTFLLDDDQVQRYPNARPVEQKPAAGAKAKAPANKSRTAANKSGNGG